MSTAGPEKIEPRRPARRLRQFNAWPILLIFLGLFLSPIPQARADNGQPRRIFILQGYHRDLPWTAAVEAELRSTLAASGLNLEIFQENMEGLRLREERYEAELAWLLAAKYRSVRFEVVIACDNPAVSFLLEHSESLFPGVPVVFCGVDNRIDFPLLKYPLFTGSVQKIDLLGSVRLALSLHPGTREVVIYSDQYFSRFYPDRAWLLGQLEKMAPKVTFRLATGLNVDQAEKDAAGLKKGSLVVILSVAWGADNKPILLEAAAEKIAAAASVPVYGCWENFLGRGVVGGLLTRGGDQGRTAARMALRILNGEKVEDIPVELVTPSLPGFDYRQLQRFGIPLSALPRGSQVINRPVTFYRQYKRLVWTTGLVLVGLILAVLILALNTVRRKRAEEAFRRSEARYQALFQTMAQGVVYQDAQGAVISANPAAEKILGLSLEEMIGLTSLDPRWRTLREDGSSLPGEEHPSMVALRTGQPVSKTIAGVFNPTLEETRWLLVSAVPEFREGQEKPFRVYVTFEDITERKRAEDALRESEERFSQFMAHFPYRVFIKDAQGRYVYASRPAKGRGALSLPPEEIIGKTDDQLYPPDFAAEILASDRRILETGQPLEVVRRDPEEQTYSLIIKFPMGPEGGPKLIGGLSWDITELKRTQQALEESEERFSRFMTHFPGMAFIKDAQGRYLYVNRSRETEEDPTPEARVGKTDWEVFPAEEAQRHRETDRLVLETGRPQETTEITRFRGENRYYLIFKFPMGPDRPPRMIGGLAVDVTELKVTQQALEESEERFTRFMAHFPGLAFIKDTQGRYLYINRSRETAKDPTPEARVGKNDWEIFPPEEARRYTENDRKVFESGQALETTETILMEGGVRHYLVSKFPMGPDLPPKMIGGLAMDMTELRRAQEALKESEERARSILEASPDPIVLYDDWGLVVYVNPAFEKVFGWTLPELEGKVIPYLPREELFQIKREDILKKLQQGESVAIETRRRTKFGRVLEVIFNCGGIWNAKGKLAGQVVTLTDITPQKRGEEERVRLEAQLRQAQKMEAIGTLAGGIAHDFNNILSAIIGYAELAEMDTPEASPNRRRIEQVIKAGKRARDLVLQILSFSRRTDQEQQPLVLGSLIQEVLRLLRATIPTTIEIKTEIKAGNDFVLADATQIHQMLMNLCANAAQAMEEKGGLLEVGLELGAPDQGKDGGPTAAEPDSYLVLSVRDIGVGMEPEVMERIFEPFFTTKEQGQGTGMGLSVVHGIVQSHGGTITVESTPGKGTLFKVFLPRLTEEMVSHLDEEEEEEFLPEGTERVLLIDDEEMLTDSGGQMLEELGYQVKTMSSSQEALEVFRADPQAFDLVISDQTMPGITGAEVAREMLKLRPDLPIILYTGYSSQIDQGKARELGVRLLLYKPLSRRVIATAIREVLDGEE